MFNYERNVCREVGYTVAVSELDAKLMKEMFGVSNVAAIPTGVDLGYFQPQPSEPVADLVFIGSMDWRPNDDGVGWFAREILPILRKQRPDCKVAIVGRNPSPEMNALGDKNFRVTGTVPDVRPYLWGSKISIVPLRIGGGTRLKIYESMAAKTAVVSTTVGAEGLAYRDGADIAIAVRLRRSPMRVCSCLPTIVSGPRSRMPPGTWSRHASPGSSLPRVRIHPAARPGPTVPSTEDMSAASKSASGHHLGARSHCRK